MSIINHPLFLIARIVLKIIIIITIIIIIINTEINDITLTLFKFVFGRNMITFDLRSTLGTHNLGIPVILGYTSVRLHFLRHFE